jgi:uncharacterized membrane protein HdeD (DUF308 family)
MKATAIALVFVGMYWIMKGIADIRQDDMQGGWLLVMGVLLLPLAKYLWDKDFGKTDSSKSK